MSMLKKKKKSLCMRTFPTLFCFPLFSHLPLILPSPVVKILCFLPTVAA